MEGSETKSPHIIGLTGSFGSGCSYVANEILAKLDDKCTYVAPGRTTPPAYAPLSLSGFLRERFQKEKTEDLKDCPRKELQDFGDKTRSDMGADCFAKQAISVIEKSAHNTQGGWIVDSIRNPAEVRALREFSRRFFLFGVYADKETRWNRVKEKYDGDRKAFDEDDERDTGNDSPHHGQRVGDCFTEADVVIANDKHYEEPGNTAFLALAGRLGQYAKLVSEPLTKQRPIRPDESLMAMAYAASPRISEGRWSRA